jgi:hypothetical protein
MSRFEDALLTELRETAETGAAARPARRPRLLAGAAAAATAAVALVTGALVLAPGTRTPAYSLVERGDGSVEIAIFDGKAIDEVNERLAGEGIRARVYAVTAPGDCPGFTWGDRRAAAPDPGREYVRLSSYGYLVDRDIPEGYTALLRLATLGPSDDPDGVARYVSIGSYLARGEAPPCAQASGPFPPPAVVATP